MSLLYWTLLFPFSFSLRTLCRALRYAAINPHQNVLRSIYEVSHFYLTLKQIFGDCKTVMNPFTLALDNHELLVMSYNHTLFSKQMVRILKLIIK